MRLNSLLVTVLAAVALGGCVARVKAPTELGVCYFIGHPKGPDGKSTFKFNVVARDQPDVEHCAVQIYNARMAMLATNTAGKETEGAYQGNFLEVTNTEVRFSQTYEGPYFPLLVKAPDNRLVAPGSVVIDDTPAEGPQTVTVPKDLPEKNDGGVVVTQNPGDAPPAPAAKTP